MNGESAKSAHPAQATTPARVLVVIVNYRTAGLTLACLESLSHEVRANPWIRAVVVDNASGDAETLARGIEAAGWGGWAHLEVAERNGGFSYGNNQGIGPALALPDPPDYFLLLNSDTEVRQGAIGALVEFMDAHPKVGIAGGSFETPDGTDWPYAFRFPSLWSQFEQALRLGLVSTLLRNRLVMRPMSGEHPEQVDWVSGASLMVRRQVFETVGLMDEGYFLYFEDLDFCLQAGRRGWPCWYVPRSRVMHIGGQSTGGAAGERIDRRLPQYWYASKNRFFVKSHGVAYARLADAAFILGLVLWNIRRVLTRRKPEDPPHFFRDFVRSSTLFNRVKSA